MPKDTTADDPRRVNGVLTREAMEEVVRTGGAVSYRGLAITRIEDLPEDTELANLNVEATTRAEAQLDLQQARLDAERRHLAARTPAPTAPRAPAATAAAGPEPEAPAQGAEAGGEASRTAGPAPGTAPRQAPAVGSPGGGGGQGGGQGGGGGKR